MDLENPQIPEGINTSNEHPLKELLILLAGIAGFIIVTLLVLNFFVGAISKHIPFEYEQKIAEMFVDKLDGFSDLGQTLESEQSKRDQEAMEAYLNQLGQQLIKQMDIDEDIEITIHYFDDDVENAFATLGGHVFMYKGLLSKLPHENAIATVLGHEIAHVKHRHPVVAMGRGIALMTALAAVAGVSDTKVAGMVGNISNLGSLSFSRQQETESDLTSLKAMSKHYGHVNGSDALFLLFADLIEESHGGAPPEILSTHPDSMNRAERIGDWAKKYDWQMQGELTPIPDHIQTILNR